MADQPFAEVIGDPVAHSKSPVIHRFWLDATGVAGDYRKTPVTADELGGFLVGRRDDSDWRGCNVTVPHKIAVLDHVQDRGGVRATIGAANVVFRAEDGALVATNTDAAGFYAPIAGLELEGRSVTVIGAGGAARAILFALSRVGVGPVTILNRSPLKAAALLSIFGLKGRALPLDAAMPPSALVVNASTLGMTGQPTLDVDLSGLDEDAVVYDAVYAPVETPLLAQARALGLETVDGLEMLVAQAAVGFELFFGVAPPQERDADLRALLLA